MTASQRYQVAELLSASELVYGKFMVTRVHLNALRQGKRQVFVSDAKGMSCAVLNFRFRPFQTVQDAIKAVETRQKVFANGYVEKRTTLLTREGKFPTGLLPRVYDLVGKVPGFSDLAIIDERVAPKRLEGLFVLNPELKAKLRPEQLQAAVRACSEHRGVLSMPTGTGKSITACAIIEALQVPTLIVVPGLKLKLQLREALAEAFGSERVGGLGAPIAVENVDSLNPKKELKGYGCLIVDEFHHAAAASYRKLNQTAWAGIFYRFGLTATFTRSSPSDRLLMHSILSEVILRLSFGDAVAKGYIVPLEFYSVKLPMIQVEGTQYHAVYSEAIVERNDRSQRIVEMVASLHSQKRSTLVLVKQINHGLLLQDKILTEFGISVPFASGDDEESDAKIANFSSGAVPVLIATGIVGEGIDCKAAEWVILAGGIGNSQVQQMQNIGRVTRRFEGKESGKVVVFQERSHRWFKTHFDAFVELVRREYGTEVTEL